MLEHSTHDVAIASQIPSVICRGLDARVSDRVAGISSRQACRARQTVFYEGDPGRYVYEVIAGVLKLCKLLPDGRQQITGFLYPGQLFGLVLHGDYIYTAEAVTDVKLGRFPISQLDRMADEVPGLGRSLLALTTHELVTAQEQMLLLGRKSSAEKVASFLQRLSEANEERGDDPLLLHIPMVRSDIADYLGLTTETVSRTITKLKDGAGRGRCLPRPGIAATRRRRTGGLRGRAVGRHPDDGPADAGTALSLFRRRRSRPARWRTPVPRSVARPLRRRPGRQVVALR